VVEGALVVSREHRGLPPVLHLPVARPHARHPPPVVRLRVRHPPPVVRLRALRHVHRVRRRGRRAVEAVAVVE
jgi:hypothetical protein